MVKTGLDILFSRKRLLAGKRLALVANPSSIDSRFRFIVDLFHQEKDWKLKALFGPEHGMRGEMQDQESCETHTDPATHLPVHSLYGQHLKPAPEMLSIQTVNR